MDRKQRIITAALWGVLVLSMLGVVGTGLWAKWRDAGGPVTAGGQGAARLAGASAEALPVLYEAPAFSLTDQEGRPFASDQLRGKVWVADFIFTHCPGACPLMTQKMASLQKAVPDRDVRFVSFSVDPERDTPEVLKQYGQRFDADPARWHFLTGPKDAIFATAAGLKLSAMPAGAAGPDIVHSEKFLLVDGEGRVRGAYGSNDEAELKRLSADAAKLADRQAGRVF